MQEFIQTISNYDPLWIYIIIFLVAYIENIFPPSPSDVLVVFGGSLAAIGRGNFLYALLAGTIGGTLGFITMYLVGKWFGDSIVETGKIKFIQIDKVHKLENWFRKYGYWVVVINRFLTGTRAVVSFFAGMSELNLTTTILLSFAGSLIWYTILVYFGFTLGNNWQQIEDYLQTYSLIIAIVIVCVIIFLVLRRFYLKGGKW